MNTIPFIELESISKSFPGVKALVGVGIIVYTGEFHGLVGEKGAGKSTLIKIIMGVYQKDQGVVKINGEEVNISNVIDAGNHGLAAVYQDLNLALDLSIGENFFMGQMPRKKSGLIDWKSVFDQTGETLKTLNVDIDPRLRITELSPAMQEMVSIAKSVHKKSKFMIFDEPTALLSNEEVEILFSIIRKLKSQGIAIIYISHRLEEIFTICDTVSVFKDGKWVDTTPVSDTNEDDLIAKMVGRSVTEMYNIDHQIIGKELLKLENFTRNHVFEDISFSVHEGEIFGLFGLVGSGRTEIVRAIFGADRIDGGVLYINGEQVSIHTPAQGIQKGIGFLPEDKKEQGLALELSVKENINLASYNAITRLLMVDQRKERKRAETYRKKMNIKTPSIQQLVKNLSGGNQQKVVISKWLCCNSNVYIFDEPTVGVDVGAKREIYNLMQELTAKGQSIILISSYLPEVMGLSDRIGVIHEGKLQRIVPRSEFSEELLLRYASGLS
ncbi:MAG: sugar ABC transporter ATP-binding protein [Sphaerochaetaceae bacterium]